MKVGLYNKFPCEKLLSVYSELFLKRGSDMFAIRRLLPLPGVSTSILPVKGLYLCPAHLIAGGIETAEHVHVSAVNSYNVIQADVTRSVSQGTAECRPHKQAQHGLPDLAVWGTSIIVINSLSRMMLRIALTACYQNGAPLWCSPSLSDS